MEKATSLGAGEFIINSIDGDGMKKRLRCFFVQKGKKLKPACDCVWREQGTFEDFYHIIVATQV